MISFYAFLRIIMQHLNVSTFVLFCFFGRSLFFSLSQTHSNTNTHTRCVHTFFELTDAISGLLGCLTTVSHIHIISLWMCFSLCVCDCTMSVVKIKDSSKTDKRKYSIRECHYHHHIWAGI